MVMVGPSVKGRVDIVPAYTSKAMSVVVSEADLSEAVFKAPEDYLRVDIPIYTNPTESHD